MEFQFGTNWSHFSRYAGGVIGQTLAMEGLFAFFLESAFLGLFLYGEKRLSKIAALVSALWSSSARGCRATSSSPPTPGCSIRSATSARRRFGATHQLLGTGAESLGLWQYAHNMAARSLPVRS